MLLTRTKSASKEKSETLWTKFIVAAVFSVPLFYIANGADDHLCAVALSRRARPHEIPTHLRDD